MKTKEKPRTKIDAGADKQADRQKGARLPVDQMMGKILGGTFESLESGARGDNVHASNEFDPEVAEEEERINANDPERRRVGIEDVPDKRRNIEGEMIFEEDEAARPKSETDEG